MRASGRRPSRLAASRGGDEHRGAAVRQRRRVARGDLPRDLREARLVGRVVERGLEAGQRLDRGAGPDDLVGRRARRSAPARCRSGPLWLPRRPSRGCPPRTRRAAAGEAPLGGDQFGADALRHKAVGVALRHRAERVAARQHARAHRHPAHRLDARGDHDVVGAGDHALGGEADRLLAAAALAVDGRARHRLGETGAEQRVAGDVDGLVADLGDGARDDVVDLVRGRFRCARRARVRLWARRSTGSTSCSAPPALPLPIGVRTAPTMTASRPAYPAISCLL